MTQLQAPYHVKKSQVDWHIRAVDNWNKANQNLKLFSEACYHVDNKEALAVDCKCSTRTIQYYAAAWSLYQEMLLEFGETVSLLWERGEISLWRKAPQLRSTLNLTLDKTYEYVKIAIENDMNRDSFAAHVDNKENKTPQWIRRIQHAAKILFPSKNDWKSDMPFEKRERYEKATAWYIAELKEIAEDE